MDAELEKIIIEYAKLHNAEAELDATGELSVQLQSYISEKCPCDADSLLNFVELFRNESFKKYIDIIGGSGLSDYIASAIEYYCYL